MILDSGAVIALSRNDVRARAVLAAAEEAGAEVNVPCVVLAETLRGGPRDAAVHHVLNTIGRVIPAGEVEGRTAGWLLGAAGSTSTVDALVIACAISVGGGVVLTGDPDDLRPLAADHPEVIVHPL